MRSLNMTLKALNIQQHILHVHYYITLIMLMRQVMMMGNRNIHADATDLKTRNHDLSIASKRDLFPDLVCPCRKEKCTFSQDKYIRYRL